MPVARQINKDFFKKWTTEMAYILGFFAADGYLTRNKRGGNFWNIQITDLALLKKMQKAVRSNHRIGIRTQRGYERTVYRLQVGSKEMCADLQDLGMLERKTKRLVMPNVPQRFVTHFIRGYFDGDGNVWVGSIHKDRGTAVLAIMVMFTSCSAPFLEDLHKQLRTLGITGGSLYRAKGNFARLQLSIRDSLRLYDLMYTRKDSLKGGLFLDRKKRVFERFIALRV